MKHTTALRTVLRTAAALVTAMFLVVGLAACAGAGSNVPGTYEDQERGDVFVLNGDGTFDATSGSGNEFSGTWSIESDGGDWLLLVDSSNVWRADLSNGTDSLAFNAEGRPETVVLTRVK